MKQKLFSMTVVRNEADRYLASMLWNTLDLVDAMFVYDDQSDDATAEIAEHYGAHVSVRPDGVPSFLEHEGKFRQAAWDTFEALLLPPPGSWILAIDADECLITKNTNNCIRCEVDQAIQAAEAQQAMSVMLPVPEVFGVADDGTPLIRTDGLWNTIAGTRLFKYIPNAKFRDKSMGCGAEPVVVTQKWSPLAYGLNLLHYGYAHAPDQVAKHARYTGLAGHGHLDAHVQSIVTAKTLKRWEGPAPDMRRGVLI